MSAPPRILIIKLSAIGDCLHASPVAESLRRAFPDAHLGWVVHPHCAPVVTGNPFVNRVHLWPRKGMFKAYGPMSRELRAENYDTAIDLQGLLKSGLVSLASGAKSRIGPSEAREMATVFYSQKVARQIKTMHVIPGYLELAKAAGGVVSPEPPMFMPTSEADDAHARALLNEIDPTGAHRWVVLNPSAGKPNKMWPAERFGELANRLHTAAGVRCFITGAPADMPLAERILSAVNGDHVVNLTGRTNLNQLTALLRLATMFVGGDTGPMHIAQAVGTPTLALFGPTNPAILGPRDAMHATASIFESCRDENTCIEDLSLDMVTEKALELLSRSSSSSS